MTTSPRICFVPVTQIAMVLLSTLLWKKKVDSSHIEPKYESIFALLASILNTVFVFSIVLKLFGTDYEKYGYHLTKSTWRRNLLNCFRILLVGLTINYLINTTEN